MGCLLTSTGAFTQTTVDTSFTFDDILRTYRLYIPTTYNPSFPSPLLLNLHGYGSNNLEQELYGDFRPIADTAGFIVALPNGTLDALNNRFWNTFGGSGVDDIGFLSALIDTISEHYYIDINRIYTTGMSNGGFMSYELACSLSDRITAIASVAGSMVWTHLNSCSPLHPMPLMHIHGTADGTIPYNGSILYVPVETLVNHWVQFNNCSPTPIITPVPDIDTTDGCTAEKHLFEGGDMGSTVELYKIIDGGHSWPGAPININITNMDFSASKVIWQFFRQYSLDGLITNTKDLVSQPPHFTVYPNPSSDHFVLSFADSKKKRIVVANTFGQVVEDLECCCCKTDLHIQNQGVYFITVLQDNQTSTRKIIRY